MEAIIFYFDEKERLSEMEVEDDRLLYLSPDHFPWIQKVVFKLPGWEKEVEKTRKELQKG